MISRFLIARIRRQHIDANGYCAMWVACRYIEPFGDPCWAVCVHPMAGEEREIARAKWLWLAAWRAFRIEAARQRRQHEVVREAIWREKQAHGWVPNPHWPGTLVPPSEVRR